MTFVLATCMLCTMMPSYADEPMPAVLAWTNSDNCPDANKVGPAAFDAYNKRSSDAIDKLAALYGAFYGCASKVSDALNDEADKTSPDVQLENRYGVEVAGYIVNLTSVNYLAAVLFQEQKNMDKYNTVYKDTANLITDYVSLKGVIDIPDELTARYQAVLKVYGDYLEKYPPTADDDAPADSR